MSQLKWGVFLSYISMGLGVLVSLVYTPFMLRILGQSEWGLYQLVASVVGYLNLLSFGFGSAYIRFYSRAAANDDEDAVGRLNGLFLVVFAAIGTVALAAGAVLATNARMALGNRLSSDEIETARVLIGLMTVTVSISLPASVFSSFAIANERFVFQRALTLLRMLVTPTLTLVVLLVGYRSIGMAAVAACMAAAVALIEIAYCMRRLNMRFILKGFDTSLLREIAVFSSFIFINMIVDQVNWNVDKYILGRVGGTALVAVYAIAAQLVQYYMSLSTTVSSVFVPRVNRAVASSNGGADLTHLLVRVGRIQFIVLALIASGLVVFGRPFIALWAGPEYGAAYAILLVLVFPVTIPLIQTLGIEIQRARNLHVFRSWLYGVVAVANIALSIPLARIYGGLGAAAGTAIALLIGNGLMMNWYNHRYVGLNMVHFWRAIAEFTPALVPVVITGAGIMVIVDPHEVWQLGVWGTVFVGIYCMSMWYLGMNDFERDLVGRPISKGMGRLKAVFR